MNVTEESSLIFLDHESKKRQSTFLNQSVTILNEISHAWNRAGVQIGIAVEDIDSLFARPAKDFCKMKLQMTINEAEVGKAKISKDTLFAMMDKPNLEAVETLINNLKGIINESRAIERTRSYGVAISLSSKFYKKEDNKFKLDESYFEHWVEQNLSKFIENDEQREVLYHLNMISSGLNSLRKVKSKRANAILWELEKNPQSLLSDQLKKMIRLDENGQFTFNHLFISKF